MSEHCRVCTTLRRALPCAVAVLLLLPLVATAATVTIFGHGGVIVFPPTVCPKPSQDVCATVTFDASGPDPYEALVQVPGAPEVYRAILGELIPPGITEMPGADLVLESMELVEE